MSLKCGIVGLPNVGKSTLFNALSEGAKAAAANYPFCTIEPNVSIVPVPDARLDKITEFVKPKSVVPATVEFVDIAGLVKGASKGEGLGNQFLGHIKDTQAILHVVRCFEDGDVVHVNGGVDPLRDVEVIETELLLADMAAVEKRIDRVAKLSKTGDKEAIATGAMLQKLKAALDAGKAARTVDASPEEWKLVQDMALITQKKMLYVGNIDEAAAAKGAELANPHFVKLKDYAQKQGAQAVAISAKMEAEVAELPREERAEFLQSLGVAQSGLDKLIASAYNLLGLRTYFTAGEKEVRAWTIQDGWKAPQAAGVIHTDFERGFICAETYHYEDLVKHKSTLKVKEAGLLRTEGKEYVVKDGDILLFRFNV